MDNVLNALKHMAEHGGIRLDGSFEWVWYLDMYGARSDSDNLIGFTQDELRAFIEKYNQDQIELQDLRIEHQGSKNED